MNQSRKATPVRDECLSMMDRYGMLENIVSHSLVVTQVALALSRKLNQKGQQIDLAVVEAAALLHDLAKTECLKSKKDHARQGFLLIKELGYDRVAEVVAQHIEVSEREDSTGVSEEEVVNYADKRVLHDRIVSLKERFSDLRDRYSHSPRAHELMDRMEKSTFEIEDKIFSVLGTDPGDLNRLQEEKGFEIRNSKSETRNNLK
jgi:uncharacterized protein